MQQTGAIFELRAEIQQLQQKIHDVNVARAARGGATGDQEEKMLNDQLEAKDKREEQLKAEIAAERHRCQETNRVLQAQVHDLENQMAQYKNQETEARSGMDSTEYRLLSADIMKAQEEHKQLQAQLRRLQENKFIANTGQRQKDNVHMMGLEQALNQRTAEYQRQLDEVVKKEQDRSTITKRRSTLEEKVKEERTRNEKLKLKMEQQAIDIFKVEGEMKLMRERLPFEQQMALEQNLTVFVSSQSATFAQFDRPHPMAVPTKNELQSGGAMDQIVMQLEQERDTLAGEIQALRRNMDHAAARCSNTKGLQLQELDDVRQKSRNALQDREKWERIAAIHKQTIEDLEKQIRSFDTPEELFDDAASSTGFSELSDLEGFENSLDLHVTGCNIEPASLLRFEGLSAMPQELRSIVCVEMRGFDTGFSTVAMGLQPHYSSLVSFGPITVNDALLDHFENGNLALEVRAATGVADQHAVLGVGQQPLASLMKAITPDRPNPIVVANVPIKDSKDSAINVAKVKVKMRMRYSIQELVEDYQLRAKIHEIDKTHMKHVDPNLLNGRHTLCVQVRHLCGLPPAPRQKLDDLRPYVFYQLPSSGPHFTATGRGPHPTFEDTHQEVVNVDTNFCKWAEAGDGLHFIVFDDAAGGPPPGEVVEEKYVGFIGEVKLSLRPLLHNARAVKEGTFTLRRDLADPSSQAVGTVDISIRWQDFAEEQAPAPKILPAGVGDLKVPPPPMIVTEPGGMSDLEYQSVLGRIIRRLVANGVKSVTGAFDHLDARKTGQISRRDFLDAVVALRIQISDDEASRFFSKIDADGDGTLVLSELRQVMTDSSGVDAPQQAHFAWADELFARVRDTVNRKGGATLRSYYDALANETQPQGIDLPRFSRFMLAFRSDLTHAHLHHLWMMVDKDRNNLLSFQEFSHVFGTPNMLTDEHFRILAGRLLKKMMSAGVTSIQNAIARFDMNKDGQLERAEFESALASEGLNLSPEERMQFALRMDANGDGIISMEELHNAFQVAEQGLTQAELRVEPVFARIREALANYHLPPKHVFDNICKIGFMRRPQFELLLRSFYPDLSIDDANVIWQLVDKNKDGALVYEEFARFFVPGDQAAVVTGAGSAAQHGLTATLDAQGLAGSAASGNVADVEAFVARLIQSIQGQVVNGKGLSDFATTWLNKVRLVNFAIDRVQVIYDEMILKLRSDAQLPGSWVTAKADAGGQSADLSAERLAAIVAAGNVPECSAFITRLIQSLHCRVADQGGLSNFVNTIMYKVKQVHSNSAHVKIIYNEQVVGEIQRISQVPGSWVLGAGVSAAPASPQSGQTAPLSAAGLAGAAAVGDVQHMVAFVTRVIQSMQGQVVQQASLSQFANTWMLRARQASCVESACVPIYDEMTAKLRSDALLPGAWLSVRPAAPTVMQGLPGTAAAPQSGQTAPLDASGLAGAAATANLAHVEAFLTRVVESLQGQVVNQMGFSAFASKFMSAVKQVNCDAVRSKVVYDQIIAEIRENAGKVGSWVMAKAQAPPASQVGATVASIGLQQKAPVQPQAGVDAPLSAAGLASSSATGNVVEVETFVSRAVQSMQGQVMDQRRLGQFANTWMTKVREVNCEESRSGVLYDSMIAEIRREAQTGGSWVSSAATARSAALPHPGHSAPLNAAGFVGAVATGNLDDVETFICRVVQLIQGKVVDQRRLSQFASTWMSRVKQVDCDVQRVQSVYDDMIAMIRADAQSVGGWVAGGAVAGAAQPKAGQAVTLDPQGLASAVATGNPVDMETFIHRVVQSMQGHIVDQRKLQEFASLYTDQVKAVNCESQRAGAIFNAMTEEIRRQAALRSWVSGGQPPAVSSVSIPGQPASLDASGLASVAHANNAAQGQDFIKRLVQSMQGNIVDQNRLAKFASVWMTRVRHVNCDAQKTRPVFDAMVAEIRKEVGMTGSWVLLQQAQQQFSQPPFPGMQPPPFPSKAPSVPTSPLASPSGPFAPLGQVAQPLPLPGSPPLSQNAPQAQFAQTPQLVSAPNLPAYSPALPLPSQAQLPQASPLLSGQAALSQAPPLPSSAPKLPSPFGSPLPLQSQLPQAPPLPGNSLLGQTAPQPQLSPAPSLPGGFTGTMPAGQSALQPLPSQSPPLPGAASQVSTFPPAPKPTFPQPHLPLGPSFPGSQTAPQPPLAQAPPLPGTAPKLPTSPPGPPLPLQSQLPLAPPLPGNPVAPKLPASPPGPLQPQLPQAPPLPGFPAAPKLPTSPPGPPLSLQPQLPLAPPLPGNPPAPKLPTSPPGPPLLPGNLASPKLPASPPGPPLPYQSQLPQAPPLPGSAPKLPTAPLAPLSSAPPPPRLLGSPPPPPG